MHSQPGPAFLNEGPGFTSKTRPQRTGGGVCVWEGGQTVS